MYVCWGNRSLNFPCVIPIFLFIIDCCFINYTTSATTTFVVEIMLISKFNSRVKGQQGHTAPIIYRRYSLVYWEIKSENYQIILQKDLHSLQYWAERWDNKYAFYHINMPYYEHWPWQTHHPNVRTLLGDTNHSQLCKIFRSNRGWLAWRSSVGTSEQCREQSKLHAVNRKAAHVIYNKNWRQKDVSPRWAPL